MQRRELLRTAGFAAGMVALGGTAAGRSGPPAVPGDHWFLDWLPPGLVKGNESFSFGASTARIKPDRAVPAVEAGDRQVSVLGGHASVSVAVGADPDTARRRLQREGYDRVAGRPDLFGREWGTRHRAVAIDDEGVVTATGPAADPATEAAMAVAGTDGVTAARDPAIEDVLGRLLPARHLSVDRAPAPGVAAVGERVEHGPEQSTVLTVVVPDGEDDRLAAGYLDDLADADGVHSAEIERRGDAFVRELDVSTDALIDPADDTGDGGTTRGE